MDLLYLVEKELLRRNRSPQTVKTYLFCLKQFLAWLGKEPRKATKTDVQNYLYKLVDERKAARTLNVHLMAVKFALEEILNKRFFVKIPFSKVPMRIPSVLSQEQTKALISAVQNPKHKLMVSLLYAGGLRASELLRLRVRDLDLARGYGWVRQGKGGKDRPFIIPVRLREELGSFLAGKHLAEYVFCGRKGHLHIRSLQAVIEQAGNNAKLPLHVHPHMLRHSFATHLVEQGVSLLQIQSLLGHSSVETTSVYVHSAKQQLLSVISPFDKL
jgi:integrase/recombinase XerD